jgi:hypothetical protein
MEDLIASHLSEFSAEGGVYLPGSSGYDACLLAAAGANYACKAEGRAPPIVLQPACERDVVLAVRAVAEGARRGLWPTSVATAAVEADKSVAKVQPVMTVCGGGHSELCVGSRV